MIAALLFVVVLAGLALFQVALALGAPLGRFTWGGKHPGTLPGSYRVVAVVSVAIYAVMALLALDRAGIVDVVPDGVSLVGMWVVVAFSALSVIPNAISPSRGERRVMTPVSAVLAVLALIVGLRPRA